MYHSKSHRGCHAHREMNHAHTRNDPAMQHQLEQNQYPTFQAATQDQMMNRPEQDRKVMRQVKVHRYPTQEG